jgi:hypothetical protein
LTSSIPMAGCPAISQISFAKITRLTLFCVSHEKRLMNLITTLMLAAF